MSVVQTASRAAFNVEAVRSQFPILHQEVNGYPLVYLDNAASVQKPDAVIDAIANYYRHDHANVQDRKSTRLNSSH